MITLEQFLRMYGPSGNSGIYVDDDGEIEIVAYGNALVSIEGVCEEYQHEDVYRADWWHLYREYQVKSFQIIGGGEYPLELCIKLYGMEGDEEDE